MVLGGYILMCVSGCKEKNCAYKHGDPAAELSLNICTNKVQSRDT
jgi:hypothetical protein